jgi:hypothetical protein
MAKSRMRRAGHGARMGDKRVRIGYWWESQKERDPEEDRTLLPVMYKYRNRNITSSFYMQIR